MKVLIGAVVATMVFASVAAAQDTSTATAPAATAQAAAPVPASRCPAATPAGSPPDGSTIPVAEWNVRIAAHNAWIESVNSNLACRAAELRELRAQVDARIAEHTQIRTAAEEANSIMTVQQTFYCARRGVNCEAPQ